MFLDNKYTKIYYKIINSYKNRPIDGYKERHHIIPLSLGGDSKADNLVYLTAKAHFVCHHLLTKMLVGEHKSKMIFALWRMIHSEQQTQKITAKMYETIRRDYAANLSETMSGENNPFYGRTHSEESKQKMREKAIGRNPHIHRKTPYSAWNKGITKETDKGVRKISESKKGDKNPMFGKIGVLHHNAYTLELYNSGNEKLNTFYSRKEMEEYCRKNNIPFKGIYNSHVTGVPYIDGSKNHRYIAFNGWYTVKLLKLDKS